MKSVVVGLGEFGFAAAVSLAQNGAEVIAIDLEMSLVEAIKDRVTLAVRMDATNQAALEAQDLASCDVFVAAIGSDFESQILAVVHASRLGIPQIVARAATPTHREILVAVGAHVVLNPEEEAARRIVQSLLIPNVSKYFELADGFSLVEIPVPKGAVGRSLVDLQLRPKFRLNVVAIIRPGSTGGASEEFDPIPQPEAKLNAGEVLALVGSDLDIARFLSELG